MATQRYFITGMQRSGTTVIHHALRGHPQVSAFRFEVGIDPFFRHGASHFCYGLKLDGEERERALRALFDAIASLEVSEDTQVHGVKTLPLEVSQAQLFVESLINCFPEALVIRVRRNDLVARFGSLKKSQRTKIWHREGGKLIRVEDGQVESESTNKSNQVNSTMQLDRYEFLDYALKSIAIERELDRLSETHDVFEIEYESDIDSRDLRDGSALFPLFEFLGVDLIPPRWLQMKKLSPSAEEYITNYTELDRLSQEVIREIANGTAPGDLRHEFGPPLVKRVYESVRWHLNHPILTTRKVWKAVTPSGVRLARKERSA